jgi:hypothetical protein
MGLWGSDKPELKLKGSDGTGWLKSSCGYKVVRITSAGETLHAKWVEVTDVDITDEGRMQIRHNRRMLRFNALQLWHNLLRQGWRRVPPQW